MTRKGPDANSEKALTPDGVDESRLPYSSFAVAAMVTAACSILCPPLGVVGLILGAAAMIDLRHRRGTRRGKSFATVGVVIGGVTTGLSLGVGLWFLQHDALSTASEAAMTERSAGADLPLVAERQVVPASSQDPEPDMKVTARGAITLVDIGPRVRSLVEAIDEQKKLARIAGQRLLVWVIVSDCEPCRAFDEELDDPLMQRALDRIRLVRLDAAKFAVELSHLGVPVDAFPGFALLGDDGHAVDYVHGGEWNADIAVNIAPVLESFVRGTYDARRHPWRGGGHEDETPI